MEDAYADIEMRITHKPAQSPLINFYPVQAPQKNILSSQMFSNVCRWVCVQWSNITTKHFLSNQKWKEEQTVQLSEIYRELNSGCMVVPQLLRNTWSTEYVEV